MRFYRQLELLFKSESMVKFDNLIKVAHEIKAINPLALYGFVNLILRPMQSELNVMTAELGSGVVKQIGLKDLFTEKMEPYLYELNRVSIERHSNERKLKVNCDIAFTRPWNRQRYIENHVISRLTSPV